MEEVEGERQAVGSEVGCKQGGEAVGGWVSHMVGNCLVYQDTLKCQIWHLFCIFFPPESKPGIKGDRISPAS